MSDALLELRGLSKTYRSGEGVIQVLTDVSLDIRHGEFVAVLGRSGSGKSTLLHLLGLLDRPDSGAYTLRGRRIAELDEHARAAIRNREIGFVFQFPTLLPRATAVENVALPLAYRPVPRTERLQMARAALEDVGLGRRAAHRPQQLSGGEQQRVAIARAIAGDPALILADEPTGSLDSATSREILSLLENLNQAGRTIVVVTHDPEVARRARRRITLHDGRIVDHGDRPLLVLAGGTGR